MDSVITAAARALAAGDPLGALNQVALRDDAPSLALRGIAMAQLGDFSRARALLKHAARAFGSRETVARARCVVAEAEVALASRDFGHSTRPLEAAIAVLQTHGDRANVTHARYLQVRRLLLTGHIDKAEAILAGQESVEQSPVFRTIHELSIAGIAMRRVQAKAAGVALGRAQAAAQQARIPALMAEVEAAVRVLNAPAARLADGGKERLLRLDEIELLLMSNNLVIDACRLAVRCNQSVVSFRARPILFQLARALAEAWPEDVPREVLIARAFRLKTSDESFRARLRVEIGRLRKKLAAFADIRATQRGFVITSGKAGKVVVLAQPVEEKHAEVLALLADGEAWSSASLALALGVSQRTMQRSLDVLCNTGKVQSFGRGRARRYLSPPIPGFATTLLLPAVSLDN